VLTFAQHCEIPVILARMLSKQKQEEERPTAAELVRTPAAVGLAIIVISLWPFRLY
jgi:hypothetical protein